MCNVKYTFSEDGSVAYGHLPDGIVFMVDTASLDKIAGISFYRNYRDLTGKILYVMDRHRKQLHRHLVDAPRVTKLIISIWTRWTIACAISEFVRINRINATNHGKGTTRPG